MEPLITKDMIYNSAYITARWLKDRLEPGSKILTFGEEGFNQELIENGFNAELLRPIFDGETETSNTITDAQFGNYQVDPEVKAIAKGFCCGFD